MDNRYTSLDFEQLTPEQQQLHHQIATSRKLDPAQRLGGPFDPWIESPVLGEILSNLGYFHRFQSSLNRRQIELAILVTAAHWQAAFEWWAHEPMARDAGLTDSVITAIKHRQPPRLGDPLDQITWEVAGALQHAAASEHRALPTCRGRSWSPRVHRADQLVRLLHNRCHDP